ncbi:tyrosinase family protein [uncultured Shewanella sp.]|uniref:tyrosinase family protein n=1 Tax=uncultured Shewanella sp. TaxID=173975 RepID=UPI00261D02B5|nr:tyrosinase family protein [uncultured Shewanella sp.]
MIRHNVLQDSHAAEQYFEAIWVLKDLDKSPWPGQEGQFSLYDFFVFWHHRAMMLSTPPEQMRRNAAHSGPVFLPWHRYMLLRLERMLGEAINDADFRLPYWDWSEDADNMSESLIWSGDYLGQFMDERWAIRLDQNAFGSTPFPRPLSRPMRRFLGQWPNVEIGNKATLRALIHSESQYDVPPYNESVFSFRNLLEGWVGDNRLHNNIHLSVGGRDGEQDAPMYGDMVLSTSPNDPTFFLHHCFIDKVWAAWQTQQSDMTYKPTNAESDDYLFHRLDDPMHTFFNERVSPRDVLDVSEYYRYDTLEDLVV